MVAVKLDERIKTLIRDGISTRQRSIFFMITGDKSRNQIARLYYFLFKASGDWLSKRVLWCSRDNLVFGSPKINRAKQLKYFSRTGEINFEKGPPFSIFLESTPITKCLYKNFETILGNRFGMCVLEDCEDLTPDLLARAIETLDVCGLVILLTRSLSSLTSLYKDVTDIHERFRTGADTGSIDERFLLSLASCRSYILMDDEFNISSISSHTKSHTPVLEQMGPSRAKCDLIDLEKQLKDAFPGGSLL